jgi:Cu2+-exporting ATPase
MTAARAALTAPGARPRPIEEAGAGCAHCGAALGGGQARFCCHGCEAASALVSGLGLDAFYRRRRAAPGTLRPTGAADDVTPFVQARDGACRLQLHVDGLVCGACVWLAETALAGDPAVREARVNFSTRRLSLAWDGPPELGQALADRLAAIGFRGAR